MKHLIKDLEWGNGKVVTPFTEYEVMPDGDKWKVKYFNKFDGEPAKDATGQLIALVRAQLLSVLARLTFAHCLLSALLVLLLICLPL